MSNTQLTRGEYGDPINPKPGAWFGEDNADNERITEDARNTPSWDGWYPVANLQDATGQVAWDSTFGWMKV